MCWTNLCQLLNWALSLSCPPASLLIDCPPLLCISLSASPCSVSLLLSPSDALVLLCVPDQQPVSQAANRPLELSLTCFCARLHVSQCVPLFSPTLSSTSPVSLFLYPSLGFVVSGFPKLKQRLPVVAFSGWFSFRLSSFPFPSVLFTLCMSSGLAG